MRTLIPARLITLAIIQVAVVIVLIYLYGRVGDMSSEVDDLSSDVDGISSNVGGISSEVCSLSTDVEDIIHRENMTDRSGTCLDILILYDEFGYFNLTRSKHEITLGGGRNQEFQCYDNNRSNSYVKDGVLYIKPSFLVDDIVEASFKTSGYKLDL